MTPTHDTFDRGRICWFIDQTCPGYGDPVATGGRAIWCSRHGTFLGIPGAAEFSPTEEASA